MAVRRARRDAEPPVEVDEEADGVEQAPAQDPAEGRVDDAFDDELEPFDEDELEAELDDEDEEEPGDETEEVVDPAGLEDDGGDADEDAGQDPAVAKVVTGEAAFDDEEDARVVAAVADDDDEVEAVDDLREDEFVCRSCYMVLSTSQLVDADAMLCRDCA